MNRASIKKTGIGMLTALYLLAGFLLPVKAAPAAAPLMVTQTLTGKETNGTVAYRLESLASGNPMPKGSQGDDYYLTLTGNESKAVPLPVFEQSGTYQYRFGLGEQEQGYRYEDTNYIITVYVSALIDGSMRTDVVAVNAAGVKVEECTYTHHSRGEATPIPTKTPPVPVQKSGLLWVKTGDTTRLAGYVVLSGTALLVLAVLLVRRRSSKEPAGSR